MIVFFAESLYSSQGRDSYSISSDHLKKPDHHPLVMECAMGWDSLTRIALSTLR